MHVDFLDEGRATGLLRGKSPVPGVDLDPNLTQFVQAFSHNTPTLQTDIHMHTQHNHTVTTVSYKLSATHICK